jgi:hypothetical protein
MVVVFVQSPGRGSADRAGIELAKAISRTISRVVVRMVNVIIWFAFNTIFIRFPLPVGNQTILGGLSFLRQV